jgi:hypothetical protein
MIVIGAHALRPLLVHATLHAPPELNVLTPEQKIYLPEDAGSGLHCHGSCGRMGFCFTTKNTENHKVCTKGVHVRPFQTEIST